MFDAAPPAWGRFLPAHGAVRVMMDGAFTASFDETGALLLAVGWLLVLGALAVACSAGSQSLDAPRDSLEASPTGSSMSLETMFEAIGRLERAGYRGSFAAEDGGLRCLACGRWHAPGDVAIDEIVRFEGDSDPADEAVLLRSTAGAASKGEVRHSVRPSHGAS